MARFLEWIEQDCTKCASFSDIWLRSDLCIVMPQSQAIKVTCRIHGVIQNKLLYVCDRFEFDPTKPEIVYLERRAGARNKRFFVRIGSLDKYFNKEYKKQDLQGDIDPLTRAVYDLVCKVYQEHGVKSWMKFVIERMHLDTGVERQSIWRCVMGMIESGYLVREELQGQVVVSPPSAVLSIAEVKSIGKMKESA